MAVKQYVSLLELNADMYEMIKASDANSIISISAPVSPDADEHRTQAVLIRRFSSDVVSEMAEAGTMPFDKINEKRLYASIEAVLSTYQIPSKTIMELPHILELEFLKNSAGQLDNCFQLEPAEWGVLYQTAILHLFAWCRILGSVNLNNRTQPITSELLFECLEAKGFIKELDLDAEGSEQLPKQIITKIYQTRYTPFLLKSRKMHESLAGQWFTVPISSTDVLDGWNALWMHVSQLPGYRVYMCGYMLLALPLFMVFSILERETSIWKSFDYHSFAKYKDRIPRWFDWENGYRDTGEMAHTYSHGYVSYTTRYEYSWSYTMNKDASLIVKVFSQAFKVIQEQAVDKNIPTLSKAELRNVANCKKANILLNQMLLDWTVQNGGGRRG